jgi:hypothetical protein
MKLLKTIPLLGLLLSLTANAKAPANINNVKVYSEYEYDAYFKDTLLDYWCKPLTAKDPTISPSTYGMVHDAVRNFSAAYPKEVLHKYLRGIFLLSSLNCSGKPYGGTYAEKSIYLNIYDHTLRSWLDKALHHEFSSVLADATKFSFSNFAAISGHSKYDSTIEYDCLTAMNCRIIRDDLLEKGFLNDYGRTSYENDFNTYAEALFIEPSDLKFLARKYPLVNKKYQVIKKFYNDLGVQLP